MVKTALVRRRIRLPIDKNLSTPKDVTCACGGLFWFPVWSFSLPAVALGQK
jgi:hypothetical protein